MTEKTRFLVGFRYSATVPQEVVEAIDVFMAAQQEIQEVRRLSGGQRVLEMSFEQAGLLAAQRPDLSIEEDRALQALSLIPGLPPRLPQEIRGSLRVRTVDDASGEGLGQLPVYGLGREIAYEAVTDENGRAGIDIHETALGHILAAPRQGYWSKIVLAPAIQEETECEIRLQKQAPASGYDWWQRILGLDQLEGKFTGRGVKIGLVDSGVAEHESLNPAGGKNALAGDDSAWRIDEDGHGTHCAGVLTAQGNGITGMAPAAELYSVKVYPGGRLSDFVEALNWCIDNYMDVVCIGVGSTCPAQQMEVVLLEAYDRGITCVAAAGNDGGPVAFPAAYDHVLAVSAMGKAGTFPEDAVHAWALGEPSGYEGLFSAAFSNVGPEIDLCAPGVAILSTVPGGHAAWDGTSMACASVAGLAALILAGYPEIRTGDAYQTHNMRRILFASATDLGLPRELQGAGLPDAAAALADAVVRRAQDEADLKDYKKSLKTALTQARREVEHIERALAELNDK